MESIVIVYALVLFLHNLFTVVWMGGVIVAAISVLPAAREALGPGPQVKKVMAAFLKRQSLWAYISMAGLIFSGMLLGRRNPAFSGLFSFGDPYGVVLSIKHIVVILMIAISLYRTSTQHRLQAVPDAKKERLSMLLLLVNVVLAVIVLLLSAFLPALGTA